LDCQGDRKDPDGVYGYVGENPKRDSEGLVLPVLNEDATRRVILAKDAVMSGDGKYRPELTNSAQGVVALLFAG